MISVFKILCKRVHCNLVFLYYRWLLEMSLKCTIFWRKNLINNSFKIIIEYILRIYKLYKLELHMSSSLSSCFIGSQILDLTCEKRIERLEMTFRVLAPSFLIKHYIVSMHKWFSCDFFPYIISNISSLNMYNYN